ncbi:ribonuclease E activity regulator RraA [Panacagrimonas sp.]|uniref:ribonuclease E activity regulator RraA n=1 Tax=Panacagrimonas sp. TaxID=2480088 RepID=UPI003B52B843
MSYATTDLCDAHPEAQTCEPIFGDFGGRTAFFGPIKTLKVFEDNALVRATLETAGEGRVLVVDGGGSTRCALFGGNLGQLAVKNAWAGVVVYGLIRDSIEISQQDFGLKALGTHPRKSEKGLHTGHADRVVTFAGVTFKPGAWLYADADGVLVSDQPLHD